jgi:hypothetical protein
LKKNGVWEDGVVAWIESPQKQQKLIHGSIACNTKQMNGNFLFFLGFPMKQKHK